MKLINRVLSLFYPSLCAFCKTGMPYSDSGVYICPDCMEKLSFSLGKPRCTRCGAVMNDYKYTVCSNCRDLKKQGVTVCDRVTFPIAYDDLSKRAIIPIKKGEYLGAVSTLCGLIRLMIDADFANVKFDYVVSVPPRRARMIKPNFDQTKLLAEQTAKLIGVPYMSRCFKRVRKTKKQSKLSREERRRNIHGAFALGKSAQLLRDKTVLVIDDITTSGATLNECARVLKEAGTARVYGAVIASSDHRI